MSEPQKKKNLTPELRILVASLLSMGVILVWAKFFAPKPVVPPPGTRSAVAGPATSGTPAAGSASAGSNAANAAGTSSPQSAKSAAAAPAVKVEVRNDAQERTIVVENALYRVEFSNRGAVVKSWQLKEYKDDSKPQKTLDLVHAKAAEETGGWPLAVVLEDEKLQAAADSALYKVSSAAETLEAPADVEFDWSDGHLEVSKRFHFDHSYVAQAQVSAKYDGKAITAGLAWLGGFGDLTVTNPVPVETVTTYYSEGGKLTNFPHKKLDGRDKWPLGVWQGGKDWTGIEDRYFLAAFLPGSGAAPGSLEARYWKDFRTVQVDGKDVQEPVPQIATATSAQPTKLRVFVGPKDYDVLKKMNPPLNAVVSFGMLEFIADPLFHGLKWLHDYIPNWGWAIVVLTLVINMLLFPLRISSYKTTLKMQRVGAGDQADPGEIQEIYDARSAQSGDEQGSDGGVQPRRHQSGGRMLSDVFADADLVRAEHGAAIRDRDASRAMVRVDHGPVGERSLLCAADHHGIVNVPGVKNDADDGDRSAAADDDEDHAHYHGGNFHDFAHFERAGSVHSDQQPGGHCAAILAEPVASGHRPRQSWRRARSKIVSGGARISG